MMSATGSEKGPLGPDEGLEGDIDLGPLSTREEKVRSEFWDKFKSVAARIPFADDLVSAYYCALDPQTPTRVRGMLLGALAYFILPIDGIPDMILGLGYTDDAAVLAAVVSMVSRHITPTHRAAAAKALGKDVPEENEDTA